MERLQFNISWLVILVIAGCAVKYPYYASNDKLRLKSEQFSLQDSLKVDHLVYYCILTSGSKVLSRLPYDPDNMLQTIRTTIKSSSSVLNLSTNNISRLELDKNRFHYGKKRIREWYSTIVLDTLGIENGTLLIAGIHYGRSPQREGGGGISAVTYSGKAYHNIEHNLSLIIVSAGKMVYFDQAYRRFQSLENEMPLLDYTLKEFKVDSLLNRLNKNYELTSESVLKNQS
jgi:hypothetical protein